MYIFLSYKHAFVPNCIILLVKLNFFLTSLYKNKYNLGHTLETTVGHLFYINGIGLPGSLRHLILALGSLMSLSFFKSFKEPSRQVSLCVLTFHHLGCASQALFHQGGLTRLALVVSFLRIYMI